MHEPVQTAEAADQFMARPDKKVVGVAQNDLSAKLQQVFRGNGLDRTQGTHGHEYWSVKAPVHGGHPAATGRTFRRLMQELVR